MLHFWLDVPESLVVPVSHEVSRHELVEGEGDVLVSEGGHHLPGVRAPVSSVQLEPAQALPCAGVATWPAFLMEESTISLRGRDLINATNQPNCRC